MTFVSQFDKFTSFEQAAAFIEDWIRVKKHNSTDFTSDFPAVLERGKQIRSLLLKMNTQEVGHLILTKKMCTTEHEYVFYFTVQLLEYCCLKSEVPLLVNRVLVNTLGKLVKGGLQLSKEMKEFSKDLLYSMRAEIVFDFVKAVNLDNVTDEYFLELAQYNLDSGKLNEAAVMILKFRYFNKFDCLKLIVELVDCKKTGTAKQLIESLPHLKKEVVKLLSTP